MNIAGSNKLISCGLISCCLLYLCYCWYFQQMAKPFENRQTNQQPAQQKQAPTKQEPITMTKVALPPPPPALKQALPKVKKPVQQPNKTPAQVKAQTPLPKQAAVKIPTRKVQTKKPVTAPVVDVSTVRKPNINAQQLLQQVEAGHGPVIEIAWPKALSKRQNLFNTLVDCLGVQLGIMANNAVHPIRQDNRQYSRLVRVVSGSMVPREQRLYQSSRHQGTAVRMFPRDLDSRLLMGLGNLAPQPIQTLQSVRGLYVMQGQKLYVKHLVMDGKNVSGQILLANGHCTG